MYNAWTQLESLLQETQHKDMSRMLTITTTVAKFVSNHSWNIFPESKLETVGLLFRLKTFLQVN